MRLSRRAVFLLAALALTSAPAFSQATWEAEEDRAGAARLNGSADWELYRSVGDSEGTVARFDAFRQRYSLDLTGAIWDTRFNRYALGLDFFRADQKVDGQRLDDTTLGYRAMMTFFPSRPFPLLLFARRSTTDTAAVSLASSDRETAAYGAEWNLATAGGRNLRAQFDKSSYDLLSPVSLKERRTNGTLQFIQRFSNGELSARYTLDDQSELVNDTRFKRQELVVEDRTGFANGSTLLVHGTRGLSDALFSTGERDELNTGRFSGIYDVPLRRRVGFNLSYDYDRNDGKFVNSTSHTARGMARFTLAEHWESDAGVIGGKLETAANGIDTMQDLAGVVAGLRYSQEWSDFHLGAAGALGFTRTKFDTGELRDTKNVSLDVEARMPVARAEQVFASVSFRKDQNDTTGVGYSFDEARGTVGLEGGTGESVQWRTSAYVRGTRYDTFQFGLQTSREAGVDGSLSSPSGGVSVGASARDGISEFIPDPASGSPFTPGSDLVNRARIAFAGGYWRFMRHLQARIQARFENREFTSIGRETVLSYHPEVEWSWAVWRISLTVSHYERNNHTSFSQDTVLLKVSRLLF